MNTISSRLPPGEECLRLLEEYGTGLALILLDIVMPGMDGFGVLDYMNRNHWIEEVPVIMISSEVPPHLCAVRMSRVYPIISVVRLMQKLFTSVSSTRSNYMQNSAVS